MLQGIHILLRTLHFYLKHRVLLFHKHRSNCLLSRYIKYIFVATRADRAHHYNDVIMGAIASQITSLTIVYSIVYSDADHRKHQSSALLAFVRGIHRRPVHSPHKWPVTRKMFPFDGVIVFPRTHIISDLLLSLKLILLVLGNHTAIQRWWRTPHNMTE